LVKPGFALLFLTPSIYTHFSETVMIGKSTGGCMSCSGADGLTHSRTDGAEGHQPLDAIGIASTPGLPAWVISLLQDELLTIEGRVLKTYPARVTRGN